MTGRGALSKQFSMPSSSSRGQAFKDAVPINLTEESFPMEQLEGLPATVSLLEPKSNNATSVKKAEYLPSKGFVIFDRTGDSMRVFCNSVHEPNLEWPFFHQTLASGIAAYENVKATRAASSPLSSLNSDVRRGVVLGTEIDELKNNNLSVSEGASSYFDRDAEEFDSDSSYFDEDSEELDALLDLDEDYDEDDEAISSVTFCDGAEAGYCSASSNEVDSGFPSENPRKRKRNAYEDGEAEQEFMPDVHCQSKVDRIEKRLNALSSMLGCEFRSKEAIFDQAIYVVQSLQKYVSTNLQKS